ncbi:MAG: hypothetical protein HC834_07360 [Rhodospirillales bacterium]|nr:hypothetical protein [Rhodospirillales bacterium]
MKIIIADDDALSRRLLETHLLRWGHDVETFADGPEALAALAAVASGLLEVVDRDAQEKIDVVKNRLIRNYGYDEVSATDVLTYVASIFARGEIKGD